MDPIEFVVGTTVEAGGFQHVDATATGGDVRVEFVIDVF